MIVRFKTSGQGTSLTLRDVEQEQFFVCSDGFLCQKSGRGEYIHVAKQNGKPFCGWEEDAGEDMAIDRILEPVDKIEF